MSISSCPFWPALVPTEMDLIHDGAQRHEGYCSCERPPRTCSRPPWVSPWLGSELINFSADNTILIRFWKGIGIVRKRIEPYLPTDVRGVERTDDRRVISGIVHVLKSGCRWCDCPPEYGPPTTSITALCAGRGAASGKSCSGSLLGTDDPQTRR
jgi:hypothetical protein